MEMGYIRQFRAEIELIGLNIDIQHKIKFFQWILKGSDDGCMADGTNGFFTLSIVQYSKEQ
jgi:hypothetical protein